MRQHSIWVDAFTDVDYASSKAFGGREFAGVNVYIGTSSSNSHHVGTVSFSRRWDEAAFVHYGAWVGTISVDGKEIVKKYYDRNWVELADPNAPLEK